ncbi:Melanotransferrinlike [Caligus rogercresseyi]|uniref:Melanotransferrinlike n=1 Tax=Caligus rogercresseyi TaxID=217165 RepID=A0A7T8JXN3_CALRO|nr:Melanotransferrinlike [Caligus rogercresseyi]
MKPIISLIIVLLLPVVFGRETEEDRANQLYHSARNEEDIMWCCLSQEEVQKCYDFAKAAEELHKEDETIFGSYYRRLKCKLYHNKNECMRVIDENRPVILISCAWRPETCSMEDAITPSSPF